MKYAIVIGIFLGLVGCGDNAPAELKACAGLPTTEDPALANVGDNWCTDADGQPIYRQLPDGRQIPRAECVTDTAPVHNVAHDCEWHNTYSVEIDVWCVEACK